jgi:glycerol-3-phosphate dehydrogenase
VPARLPVVVMAGGKWTTYRLMAEDAVNTALATGKLQVTHQCVTSKLKLLGAQGFHRNYHAEVIL